MFWNHPPPLGVVGIPRRKLIHVDEFAFNLQRTNCKYGWSFIRRRVRKIGHYKRTNKLTVLFTVEPGDPWLPPETRGGIQNPMRWIEVIRAGGTSAWTFAQFIEEICSDI